MSRAPFIPLARIIKAHGLKGEVSVKVLTGLPFDIPEGLHVWLTPPLATMREATVESVRPGPKGPLVKLSGVDTIDLASTLRGTTMTAAATDLPELIAEEPFSPVGYQVNDRDRGLLGTVMEIIVTGANDVWIVEGGPFGQVLIPVIDDVVLDVDTAAECINVALLDGLIEEGE